MPSSPPHAKLWIGRGAMTVPRCLPAAGIDPQTVGRSKVEVARCIDLDAVERFLAGHFLRQVNEGFARAQRAVATDREAQHDFALRVPVADIEMLAVRCEGDAVRTLELVAQQSRAAAVGAIHAAERQLLARIVVELRQAEWRIGEVDGAIRRVHEVVRTVQAFALIAVREHCLAAVRFDAHDAMVAVLVDRQSALRIQRESIRAGLPEESDIASGIAAVLEQSPQFLRSRIPRIDAVGVRIAEQQALFALLPHRSFGELETLGEFEDLRVGRNDAVDRGVVAHDAHIHFLRRHGHRPAAARLK